MFVCVGILTVVVVFLALKVNAMEPPSNEAGATGPKVDATASNVQPGQSDTSLPSGGAATPVSPATLNGAGAAGATYKSRLYANYGLAGVRGNYYVPGSMRSMKVGGATSPTPARDEESGRLLTAAPVETVTTTTAALKGGGKV